MMCLSCNKAKVNSARPFCAAKACKAVEQIFGRASEFGEVTIAGDVVRCAGLTARASTLVGALEKLIARLPELRQLRQEHGAATAESARLQGRLRELHDAHDAKMEELQQPIFAERERHSAENEAIYEEQKTHLTKQKTAEQAIRAMLEGTL